MKFEWSEEKRLRTFVERGLDFNDAPRAFDGRPVLTFASPRGDEARWLSIVVLDGRYIAIVWTMRGEVRRIISMRRARRGEERNYRQIHT
jgi:uncharacterized DUF497 family protein